jgi:hypothetical protein
MNNSILELFIYLRADSTAKGHLQSQHGHKQQKQWTTRGQYTDTTGLYSNNNDNKNREDRLSLLGWGETPWVLTPLNGPPLCQSRMIYRRNGASDGMTIGRGKRSTRTK